MYLGNILTYFPKYILRHIRTVIKYNVTETAEEQKTNCIPLQKKFLKSQKQHW